MQVYMPNIFKLLCGRYALLVASSCYFRLSNVNAWFAFEGRTFFHANGHERRTSYE